MSELTTFRLRECIGVERADEWMTQGIPLPEGKLVDPAAVALLDEAGSKVPLGSECLARWPDGSVKWLKLIFPATVPALGTTCYRLVAASPQEPPRCGEIAETHESVLVTNGVITLEAVIASDCVLATLKRNDDTIQTQGLHVKLMGPDGRQYRSMVESARVIENGARIVLLVTGTHVTAIGTNLLTFKAWIFLYPGQDYFDLEYQFIHTESAASNFRPGPRQLVGFATPATSRDDPRMLDIRDLCIVIEHDLPPPLHYGAGSFDAGTPEQNQYVHERPFVARLLDGPRNQYYDFWINAPLYDNSGQRLAGASHGLVDVSGDDRGIAISVYKFGQQWPKQLRAYPDYLSVDVVPEQTPLSIFQGQAKTTRLRIWLHDGDMHTAAAYYRHLAHNWPLHIDSPQTFLESGALPRLMPFKPEKYPTLETRFFAEFDQLCLLERVLGMMDYGDHLLRRDELWGREDFFANNEHDFGYTLFLQYARTGHRRFLDQALASWQHWMDVDTVHHSDNPAEVGGWRMHGAYHVLYPPGSDTSVSTSHVWAEGPVHFYLLTGHPAAREAVQMLGDYLCRACEAAADGQHSEIYTSGDRSRGWPLVALCALYEAFGEERYLAAARKVAELYITGPEAISENGDISVRYSTLVKSASRDMMAVVALGLGRYHKITGDERIRELFLRVCRYITHDQPRGLVHNMWGNEQAGMEMVTTGHWREPLPYAYELTGDAAFIQAGIRNLKFAMPSTRLLGHISGPVVGPGNTVVIADGDIMSILWRDLLSFLPYADDLGLLEDF